MFDEMKNMINQLDEKELKSALFLFYCRAQAVGEGNGYSEQEIFLDIKSAYNDLLQNQKNQASSDQHIQYQATHIVFGYSPMGIFKLGIKGVRIK